MFQNPKEFVLDLLDYLKQQSIDLSTYSDEDNEKYIVMAVIALYNAILHNLGKQMFI